MENGYDAPVHDAESHTVVDLGSTERITSFLADPNRVTLLAVVLDGTVHSEKVREYLTDVARNQTESVAVGRVELRSYSPPRHFDIGCVPFFVVSFNGATIGTMSGVGTERLSAYLRKGNSARDEELERRKQGPFVVKLFLCVYVFTCFEYGTGLKSHRRRGRAHC